MRYKRLAIFPAAIAVCGIVSGCFSYHKTVETAPAPAVVETVPAPAPATVVETVPAPAPMASSSTTTTTTTDNGVVERQKSTTCFSNSHDRLLDILTERRLGSFT